MVAGHRSGAGAAAVRVPADARLAPTAPGPAAAVGGPAARAVRRSLLGPAHGQRRAAVLGRADHYRADRDSLSLAQFLARLADRHGDRRAIPGDRGAAL